MTTSIFATFAPAYHAAGLQVIPLQPREKRPVINDWSRFADNAVEKATAEAWYEQYPNGNMGLVLGKASGVIMIDIDSEKPNVIEAIRAVLPYSPWQRIGKKGMVLAYRYSPIKTHRIKNLSGETIVECLSSKTQVVLPPSIHPDTKMPYTANCHLLEVLDQLVFLPDNVEELMRTAAKDAGETLSISGSSRLTEYVSAGSRDSSMTEMAGLFSYAVVRGERTLKEAIGMLHQYHDAFIDKVAGDEVDIDKHVSNLIKFLQRDVLDKGKVLPLGWDSKLSKSEIENLGANFDPTEDCLSKEELTTMGVSLGEEHTEWDYTKIQKYLQDEFEAHPEGRNRAEAVERVLAKVARSNQLTKIDEDRILKYISEASGLGVPVATYRGRLRELRTGDIKGNDHSEIARAFIKDLEQTNNIVHFHGEEFMRWEGSHWVKLNKNSLLAKISSAYGHLDACKRSSDINGILRVVSFTLKQGIQEKEIRGINFANGFLTQELKLLPHDPSYGMIYTLPFRYMAEDAGRFPMFSEFLHRCWGRDRDYEEKMSALQEAICVTLFGLGAKYQKAVLLHGAPSSGKTQLLRVIESMVPTEAKCAVSPDEWGDKFLPTQLHNKILNICGELSEKKLIDGQRFKDIIDGSEMSGQYKGQQIFRFKPLVTHWFASNHMPKTHDSSNGFIRRWLILTFNFPVKASERKTDIGDSIAVLEREAIVAWAVQAMPRLMVKNGYTEPSSTKNMLDELANLNNSVRYYVRESGKVGLDASGSYIQESRIYNSYQHFCLNAGGCNPVKASIFRTMMRELASEFDFTLRLTKTVKGATEAIYENITLING